jgi:hypothetical protein
MVVPFAGAHMSAYRMRALSGFGNAKDTPGDDGP